MLAIAQRIQPLTHLTAFVTVNLRFDIAAIRAEAKARYAAKLGFINRYEGAPKRHWQWVQARRAVEGAWRDAHKQLADIVSDRMAWRELPYTPAEKARMDDLYGVMAGASITVRGNIDFKKASGEFAQINWNAQQRLRAMIVAEARGEA
jgi:hypothetical protein